MNVTFQYHGIAYQCDLDKGIDLSIPLRSGANNPNAFGIQPPLFKAFEAGGFIGSVEQGGSVNCENLFMNAHGNGTHTECVGHISKERITINQSLTSFFAVARIITVMPEDNMVKRDFFSDEQLSGIDALVVRTLPNTIDKTSRMWSGNNPAYFETACCEYLAAKGIMHLLTDLPSVDPEHDSGLLSAHHAWWQYPEYTRRQATITEMIYVPEQVSDGLYLLNLMIAPIESDASPSKPIIYPLT